MTQSLMTSKRFAPLFWTQFLSAFNDNFLKNTLVFLILFELGQEGGSALITAAGALFIAPFLLFSALGGQLADKYDKATLARRLKFAEIGGAGLAVAGTAMSSLPVLFTALVYFGTVSALFGPIKYGILPDHLETADLPKANAWIEAGTFLAILGGTVAGGIAFQFDNASMVFGPALIALAVLCWICSRSIPATGSAVPDLSVDRNILRSTASLIGELRRDPRLWKSALMVSWFWLTGALFMSVLPVIVKEILGGGESAVTAYLAVFAIAVGAGSALAAWMSAGRIILLPAPIGTFLMALFFLDLCVALAGATPAPTGASLRDFFAHGASLRAAVDMAGLAITGSLLVVPSFAAIQHWAEKEHRARAVAATNALNAGFMVVGGAALAGLQTAGLGVPAVLGGLAALNLAAAILMLKFLPTSSVRDFLSILFRAVFRMEVKGLENLQKAGKAPILALNHVSFLDGAVALTLTDDEPTFAIDSGIAKRWWVRPFLKLARALPLNPASPMSTRTLIKVVQGGAPMAIFPEGRITVTGSLMKVYDGAAMVADKTGAMVVPIRLDGLEKTPFSRLSDAHGKRRLFPKVTVTILPPQKLAVDPALKGKARRQAAGAALYKIMSSMMFETSLAEDRTIPERVIAMAKEKGLKQIALEDPINGRMSYGRLLTGVSVLARKFEKAFVDQRNVGVMLPNATGSAATILGLMAAGKVPAMMNFTAGAANILSACKAASVKTIVTSRNFVEQGKLGGLIDALHGKVAVLWLEDLRDAVGFADKLRGLFTRTKVRVKRRKDDPAVILFTSGSEGMPKGVVLTHRNILANAAQAAARIDFHPGDKVFNVLPVFHSFGLTTGTILPLISGVPVYFYPSPLHYRIIPELIYASNASIIFGTDTFLSGYAKVAHPYDLRSIRYCFAGAEPVRQTTRETYMERFGVRILEGYGVTETAPVIAINTPMFNKAGTVGKLMPGMEARLDPVPGVQEGGRLFVRGPNVMAGYLLADEPGRLQPPADGWHDTGDIVTIDADGFIAIRGRAKRFAKIGGEMVSLAAVEALAGDLWPGSLNAVASVKDDRKGEKLILFTENAGATRAELLRFAKQRAAQDLMVPAEVRTIEKIPVLGSGKVDFVGVAKLAAA